MQVFFNCICIAVGDPVIKSKGGVGLDPINHFNPATFLCLYQARTWIFDVIQKKIMYRHGLSCIQLVKMKFKGDQLFILLALVQLLIISLNFLFIILYKCTINYFLAYL